MSACILLSAEIHFSFIGWLKLINPSCFIGEIIGTELV